MPLYNFNEMVFLVKEDRSLRSTNLMFMYNVDLFGFERFNTQGHDLGTLLFAKIVIFQEKKVSIFGSIAVNMVKQKLVC